MYAVGLSHGGNIVGNYLGGFKTYPETKYYNGYKGCQGFNNELLDGAVLYVPACDLVSMN